ncbi:MAG: hypothetical protein JOZ75_06485 [Candidatus Dormibacteraeota bacterium]|nr:hypothetical protein [Candidatus Dormibacteraeota bacterium]
MSSEAVVVVGEGEQDRDRVRYHVTVGAKDFEVTVHEEEAALLAPGVATKRLVEETFHFLLEHEPVTSILPSFDIDVIEGYFPSYRREIGARLAK